MPDLPTPQDAAEAALFSECWDAVLSYADLCTSGALTANQLATEAFALGMREVRAAKAAPVRGTGRRASRLPVIPQLLTAVRATAAGWEAAGLGDRLDPDLRLWLNSEKAARYTGPPLGRPVALRGLRDMQEADASLLWLVEVEALPPATVARRLGLDPAAAAQELDQVRALFRDRCHRARLDAPMDARCRGYGRLLDAVTRSPAAEVPDDLSRHLATCAGCAEAAACLRPQPGGLPAALACGVIGWGGLAYLERRRRAADVRLGPPRPGTADQDGTDPKDGTGRTRVVRGGLLGAAVLLSALALGVSMMPLGGSADDAAAQEHGDTTADPAALLPSADPRPAVSASRSATPGATAAPTGPTATETPAADAPDTANPDPEPQGSPSPTDGTAESTPSGEPTCRVAYDLVDQWSGGFQAGVTVTTTRAVHGWQVAWSFSGGQRISQTWDGTTAQTGSRVTVTAADYNASVPANGALSFGFIASGQAEGAAPYAFTLNGADCARD